MSGIESIDPTIASVKAIAQHQAAQNARHANCIAEAKKFKAALQKLADENPLAVKQFADSTEGINVTVENNHITGYYAHKSYGYVDDGGFRDYINVLGSRRIDICDQRSR
ncbi:MAG TPA: hypothetical protein VGF97_00175 [Rhizomicrobium sp.]|jgi:hypothetical protein